MVLTKELILRKRKKCIYSLDPDKEEMFKTPVSSAVQQRRQDIKKTTLIKTEGKRVPCEQREEIHFDNI